MAISKKNFNQAFLVTDSGALKRTEHEWGSLQNFRGWGNLISKRRGVRNSLIVPYGVMGIHDLSVDGDPTSPEKILITQYDGSIVIVNYSELFIAFTFIFSSSARLLLQSPDLNWWNITPDANGNIIPTVVSSPSTTIASDLNVLQSQLLGFADTSGVTQLLVNNIGGVDTLRYSVTGSETTYTTDQAYLTGVGPVFYDSFLLRHRLTIDNSGILTTTVL